MNDGKKGSKEITLSLPRGLLQATDAVAKIQETTRSAIIQAALKNYSDVYEVWAPMQEKAMGIAKEEAEKLASNE